MLWPLFALALTARADEVPPEIRGSIVESGSNRPIPEVTVLLMEAPPGGYASFRLPTRILQQVTTGTNGTFHFQLEHFGAYRVDVAKEGWGSTGTPNSTIVELSQEHPKREIKFALGRPGQLAGQVLDGDSDKPAVDLLLMAWQVGYKSGRRATICSRLHLVCEATSASSGNSQRRSGKPLIGITSDPIGPVVSISNPPYRSPWDGAPRPTLES